MSIWASVHGEDPVIYDAGYGDTTPEDGFLDVAVSCLGDRIRILARSEGENGLSLDRDGVLELQRRLAEALIDLELCNRDPADNEAT